MDTSKNCAAYTDSVSIVCGGTATLGSCKTKLTPLLSCQTKNYETPDDVVKSEMRAQAYLEFQQNGCADIGLGVDNIVLDTKTTSVGTQKKDLTAEQLLETKTTSNCYHLGGDLTNSTHTANARCFPVGPSTDGDGNKIYAPHTSVTVQLRTCDLTEDALPQIHEDLRKVAALRLSDMYDINTDPKALQCSFWDLPHL